MGNPVEPSYIWTAFCPPQVDPWLFKYNAFPTILVEELPDQEKVWLSTVIIKNKDFAYYIESKHGYN